MAVGAAGSPVRASLRRLLARYGLGVRGVARGEPIPGSHWGAPEAGLAGRALYLRADTPVHSALHEAGHFVCMDAARRARLHTDAGGDDAEECAVCYLSILLAAQVAGFGRARMLADMDAWGYSFRLGSARAWFHEDAQEACAWLLAHGLVDRAARPTFRLRGTR
jgi:hypothetical protein